jgi:hypothetical protein
VADFYRRNPDLPIRPSRNIGCRVEPGPDGRLSLSVTVTQDVSGDELRRAVPTILAYVARLTAYQGLDPVGYRPLHEELWALKRKGVSYQALADRLNEDLKAPLLNCATKDPADPVWRADRLFLRLQFAAFGLSLEDLDDELAKVRARLQAGRPPFPARALVHRRSRARPVWDGPITQDLVRDFLRRGRAWPPQVRR